MSFCMSLHVKRFSCSCIVFPPADRLSMSKSRMISPLGGANARLTLLRVCHGVTYYYYFTYHCFIEYVCDFVMSTCINGHCPYCLLKRDGATRWTRCDKL